MSIQSASLEKEPVNPGQPQELSSGASGEPQGHRNLLETMEFRGFVELSPESSGSSLNPVERNLAIV